MPVRGVVSVAAIVPVFPSTVHIPALLKDHHGSAHFVILYFQVLVVRLQNVGAGRSTGGEEYPSRVYIRHIVHTEHRCRLFDTKWDRRIDLGLCLSSSYGIN